ncbi:sugar ABC transporter ATP-binding protein [Mucilaginibacter sabulilitoris]|uniref:Sugar ABC transporter ATP-binding protein n=1 Tax=Mucilaginibacter sabulilitoris TaxID=1173583 RepID=A0ABZ0TRH9_9SPHI|nr:sugar ABC transporter ATP-binding protein [Mucilaginibacter sabulilitoris]WPU94085.1 sugar ABC transporter ATP-binding protein [Mucilaginibacter sabulilitoris]
MLAAENICKRFSGVTALDNVNLRLEAGKVTAIIGENGAGKSTLMKILSGVYDDYEGNIIFKGNAVRFKNTREAQHTGIAIIHQELNLVPHLTITENLFLGRELTNSWGMLDKKAMRLRTEELLQKLKLQVSADSLITDLKVGQQQVVEIAKALLYDAEVIIMDEPTSAISESEVEVLFENIANLKSQGKAIAYISHKLNELFKIADHYTVLRDGKTIESGEMKGITHDVLIHKMVGREIEIVRNSNAAIAKNVLLKVDGLCLNKPGNDQKQLLKNICFELYSGEILGIFGLMGAGRTELMETLLGMHPGLTQAAITLNNRPVKFKSAAEAIKAGIALVPEDRKKDGLVLGLDVKTNISLSSLDKMQGSGLINNKTELELAHKYIKALKIKTPSEKQMVKNLSGGNQQKIVIAKCLSTQPKVLMLDEPTRGIDINAKNEIYKLMAELAASGLGIIMVSSELPEIMAVSDRILVMAEGAITAEFEANKATENNILKAAIADIN